jgi:hypothetical protein
LPRLAAFEIASKSPRNPYSSSWSSRFLPPIVVGLANAVSMLRLCSVVSVASNSGAFLVVSKAGSSGALTGPGEPDCPCQVTCGIEYSGNDGSLQPMTDEDVDRDD